MIPSDNGPQIALDNIRRGWASFACLPTGALQMLAHFFLSYTRHIRIVVVLRGGCLTLLS